MVFLNNVTLAECGILSAPWKTSIAPKLYDVRVRCAEIFMVRILKPKASIILSLLKISPELLGRMTQKLH